MLNESFLLGYGAGKAKGGGEVPSVTVDDVINGAWPTGRVVFHDNSGSGESDSNSRLAMFCRNNLVTSVFYTSGNYIIPTDAFKGLANLETLVAVNARRINGNGLSNNPKLTAIDMRGGATLQSLAMANNTVLTTLILRNDTIMQPASQTNILNNSKSAAKPVHVYVPSALKASYEAATNWSTWVADGTVIFHSIEGSIYETKYADGTPIS